MDNKIIGERLRTLRESVKKTQAKIAEANGTVAQSAIYRYESGQTDVPNNVLLWYADYFDVSLDYIYGRTDKPQGKLYDFQPKIMKDNKQMQELIEMCFDPNSPANAQLKETLLRLMGEQNK